MTNIIKSPEGYIDWLKLEFDGEQVNNTWESVCEQIEFPTYLNDQLPFVSKVYLDTMWSVMSSYRPPGMAPTAADLTTLDYFVKKQEGHFDGLAASEYGVDIFKQLPGVIAELQRDRLSRRAIIRMTHGSRPDGKCCKSVQFMYRIVETAEVEVPILLVIADFRSLDLVWGLPADYYWLKKLSELVETSVGEAHQTCVVIHAASAHIYDRDVHLI